MTFSCTARDPWRAAEQAGKSIVPDLFDALRDPLERLAELDAEGQRVADEADVEDARVDRAQLAEEVAVVGEVAAPERDVGVPGGQVQRQPRREQPDGRAPDHLATRVVDARLAHHRAV